MLRIKYIPIKSVLFVVAFTLGVSSEALAQNRAVSHESPRFVLEGDAEDAALAGLLQSHGVELDNPLEALVVAGGGSTCQARGRNSCVTRDGCKECERDDIEVDVGPLHIRIPRCYCAVQPDEIEESTTAGGGVTSR